MIDWKFWHDFVHETVIAGTYNWVSSIALTEYADQKGIDAFANWLGTATQSFSATSPQGPERIRALVRAVRIVGRRLYFRLSDFEIVWFVRSDGGLAPVRTKV